MKISFLVDSLADGRIGVLEAGAGRGPDSKLVESLQLKRVLLIRKVYRFLRLEGHITLKLNR